MNYYVYIICVRFRVLLSLLLFFFNLQFTLCECECAYYCGGALFRVARGTGTAHIIQRIIL